MSASRPVALLILCVAWATRAAAQIPATFTNLQVLPKDTPRADVVATMRGFAGALGVRCTHCHVGPDNLEGMDFATDQKATKVAARAMLRMVRTINADFLKALPPGDVPRVEVSCITCHRRSTKPPRPLSDMLLTTIESRGVAPAIEQSRRRRAEALDWGLYDFRVDTLIVVANRLREQKKLDEAIAMLQLNAEMFPKSAGVQVFLGMVAGAKGDVALAEAAFRRALEIDPASADAKKGLEGLKK
jgi:hypothetical protein